MQNIQIKLGGNGYTYKYINDTLYFFLHKSSAYTVHRVILDAEKNSTHAQEYMKNLDIESLIMLTLPHLKFDGQRQGIRLKCFSLPISITLSILQGASLTSSLIPETELLRFQAESWATTSSTGISWACHPSPSFKQHSECGGSEMTRES